MHIPGILKIKQWLKTPNGRRGGLFAVIVLGIFVIPVLAQAGFTDILLGGIATIFELFTRLVGFILFLEVKALIGVAQYSNFVSPGPTAVQVGWVVARDLANMFFILILLVIAFATIVGYEEYNLRKLLPRLLIMAVVINFSKTITGIFIDMGQVIMLTFVNGFKEAAGGNFLSAFQVDTLLKLSQNGDMSKGSLVVAMMLAFVMVSIAAAVVLIMLVTLAFRLVMLWILIILSPIAFLASTIPPGQKYYSMWWDELKRYIIYGPVVAFFLWLALLTSQVSGGKISAGVGIDLKTTGGASGLESNQLADSGTGGKIPSEAASSDVILSMIIFTALLFGGLKVATQVGGVAGGALGSLQGLTKKTAKGLGRFAGRQAMKPVRDVTGKAMSGAGRFLAKNRITGGIGATMAVQGDRMKSKRAAERAKFRGTAAERAAISPSLAGKNLRSMGPGGAGSEQRKKFLSMANQANSSPATNKGLLAQEGKEKEIAFANHAGKLEKIANEGGPDANEAKKALKGFEQANFDMVPEDKRIGTVRGMSEDSAAQNVNAQNMDTFFNNASVGQMAALQKNSSDEEVKKGIGEYMSKMDGAALDKRGAKVGDLPFGATKNPEIAQWALENTANDPKARQGLMQTEEGKQQMQSAAMHLIDKAGDDTEKIGSLMVDAINTGALSAKDFEGDSKSAQQFRAAAGHVDPRALLKGTNPREPDQVAAAQATMSHFQLASDKNATRAERLRKNGNYDTIMPEEMAVTPDQFVQDEPEPAKAEYSGGTRTIELDSGDDIKLELDDVKIDSSDLEQTMSSEADKIARATKANTAATERESKLLEKKSRQDLKNPKDTGSK